MKAAAYLILEADYYTSGAVRGVKVQAVRQSLPSLSSNQIAVKVDLEIDDSWFKQPALTATIKVPAQPVDYEIPVKVDMPVKPKAPSPAAAGIQKATP